MLAYAMRWPDDEVYFFGNGIGADGLEAVADSPYLGRQFPLEVRFDEIATPARRSLEVWFGERLEFRG